jgi:hypothetical protein
MRRSALGVVVLAIAILIPSLAGGHAERPTLSPPRKGPVPNQNRVHTKTIDVCKTGECAFEHIQSAINSIPANNTQPTLVRIWPGFYKEEPSRAVPNGTPDNPNGTFSYEYMLAHPNSESLIAIVGKKNITLRGMGTNPRQVVIDAEFKKHVVIRGDRSDGIIVENLSTWHGFDHGVYILDTDGFVIDRVHSGYSREYPFLTFANDYGLMKDCEAFGGGDGGIYPGSSADTGQRSPEELLMGPAPDMGRVSTEIRNCKSYHNVLGYSGTQGDHVWFHDNELFDNAVGFVTDSETDHPNYPQNNLLFEKNKVYDNNFNVYSKNSDVKATVFAESILIPVGVGVLIASGNDNLVQKNTIYGHDNYGVWLLNGPGIILGPAAPQLDGGPFAPPFLSERNTFRDNVMYNPANLAGSGNGADFGWDGLGFTNCWSNNMHAPGNPAATSNAVMLPECTGLPITPGVPNENLIDQAGLIFIDTDGDGRNDRPICDILGTCPAQYDVGPDLKNARNFPEGYRPPPTPPTCGPSSCPNASGASVRGTKTTKPAPRPATGAGGLPATGVGTPVGMAVALLVGAGVIGLVALRSRFRRNP